LFIAHNHGYLECFHGILWQGLGELVVNIYTKETDKVKS